MFIKIIAFAALLAGLKWSYQAFGKTGTIPETPINTAWWNGLTEEWKTILLINQNFSKQGIDIFRIRQEYMNRLNAPGEAGYSVSNQSLHDLHEAEKFSLSYTDLYARAVRINHLIVNDSIDLTSLAGLDTLYMVNGPADLTPLKKLPHLKVLILNFCGVNNSVPISKQNIDLSPLEDLQELKVLHCSSAAITSLAALKNLVNLEELDCSNSGITTLSPLKSLVHLKTLHFGSKVVRTSVVAQLENLENLSIRGCKDIPDLIHLKKLKRLSIEENELSVVDAGYRITDLDFMKNLTTLEYIDLQYTSYKGTLIPLYHLKNIKAITLPPVSSDAMIAFKEANKDCKIINAFEFER